MKSISCAALLIAAGVVVSSCTVKDTSAPGLTGPSELGLAISVQASPDVINQDGGSQSAIKVTARGPNGQPIAGQTFRIDSIVNNVAQDFGTLSARTLATGSDGTASAVFTAPSQASFPGGTPTPCAGGLAGTCVTLRVTPIGTNSENANPQDVVIRLVPPGVITPPGGVPTAAFTFTPNPVSFNAPASFDASTSTPGTNATRITQYEWNFGDGTATLTGQRVTHTFTSTGTSSAPTSFNVTLTVTNDRGLSASTSQQVPVSPQDQFTGDWTFSPTAPAPGQNVFFNADQVQTSPGHHIVQYSWNFGDGDTTQPTSGFQVTHVFAQPATYRVVLSVLDDLGRKKVFDPKDVKVESGGPVVAVFTFSPGSPVTAGTTVTFDASKSSSSTTIVNYQWQFELPNNPTVTTTSGPVISHPYNSKGQFTITLIVTDSTGKSGSTSQQITVQ